jgi:hypothetical protein
MDLRKDRFTFWVRFVRFCLIHLHWVRALTVPMHLGLIDGPFVPHNLLSAQERPVPLPNFQMAPRLKILMSSGSKKGTQISYNFFSAVPASESPSGSPTGPIWRGIPVSRAYFNLSSSVPSKGALPRGPDRNAPFLEPPSSISESPWYNDPLPGFPVGQLLLTACQFLGAFEKLQKMTTNSAMSVCLCSSAWANWAPIGRGFVKFGI